MNHLFILLFEFVQKELALNKKYPNNKMKKYFMLLLSRYTLRSWYSHGLAPLRLRTVAPLR